MSRSRYVDPHAVVKCATGRRSSLAFEIAVIYPAPQARARRLKAEVRPAMCTDTQKGRRRSTRRRTGRNWGNEQRSTVTMTEENRHRPALEIPIDCCHHPNINASGVRASESFELLLLNRAQSLGCSSIGMSSERHCVDIVPIRNTRFPHSPSEMNALPGVRDAVLRPRWT
jgi:hypothetical protein